MKTCGICKGTGHGYSRCPVPLLVPKTPPKPDETEAAYHKRLRYNEYMRLWHGRHLADPEARARVYAQQKANRESSPDSGPRLRARRRGDRRRAELSDLKDNPCMDCGGRFPPECMDFDHRPGEVKNKHVGYLFYMPHKVAEEVKKCDLVCANCHRIRTRARRQENLKRRA